MFGHYFKQYGGVDNTSLLSDYEDDDGFADFLPTGTKAFYSRHRFQRQVYYAVGTVVAGFPIVTFLAFLARDADGRVTYTAEWLFSFAILTLILGSCAIVFTSVQSYSTYRRMVSQGRWMEGLFIFPSSGDIVLRFHTLWSKEEQTFPKKNITQVALVWRNSGLLCRERQRLRITHEYGSYEFDIDRLADNPHDILCAIDKACPGTGPVPSFDRFNSWYGRQLVVREFGTASQIKLKNANVVVIGAGGLGSPILMYLAAAGVGTLGIVDFDIVDVTNLHRQIIHRMSDTGQLKVESAQRVVQDLNADVECIVHRDRIDKDNAIRIIRQYDLVIDATDNPATRYIINDACVLTNRPLVSGSALGLEGTITVFNHGNGPCLRCIHPVGTKGGNCSDNGVLGPVPGVIGCLQAVEAIKIICGWGKSLINRQCMYDAFDSTFREFKLPGKKPDCAVCGNRPSISIENLGELTWTRMNEEDAVVAVEQSVSSKEYASRRNEPHVLIDVRDPVQFEICRLSNARNIPLDDLRQETTIAQELIATALPVFVICRRGVDSQTAVEQLLEEGVPNVYHITGGLASWSESVDRTFPIY